MTLNELRGAIIAEIIEADDGPLIWNAASQAADAILALVGAEAVRAVERVNVDPPHTSWGLRSLAADTLRELFGVGP